MLTAASFAGMIQIGSTGFYSAHAAWTAWRDNAVTRLRNCQMVRFAARANFQISAISTHAVIDSRTVVLVREPPNSVCPRILATCARMTVVGSDDDWGQRTCFNPGVAE